LDAADGRRAARPGPSHPPDPRARARRLKKFLAKYPLDVTGRMATLNSFLYANFPRMNFVGFYVVTVPGAELAVGPYQGEVLACGTIAFGKGVCGTAAARGETQLVRDVSAVENYIACDDETKSEIVLPVYGRNYHNEPEAAAGAPRKLIAVLDIDGDAIGAFDSVDAARLAALLELIF
jgi:L-methionine (R)-S-oxide reductase